jgi:hypothetical protein
MMDTSNGTDTSALEALAAECAAQEKEFNEKLQPLLVKWLSERRASVDSVQSWDDCVAGTKTMIDEMVAQYSKNRCAYQKMISGAASVAMAYALKAFYVHLSDAVLTVETNPLLRPTLEKENQTLHGVSAVTTTAATTTTTPEHSGKKEGMVKTLMLDRVFLDELYTDVVQSVENNHESSDPVKIVRWRDALYPQNFDVFRNVVPNSIRTWMAESARCTLQNVRERRAAGDVPPQCDSAYMEALEKHLSLLSSGGLPWDFLSEAEAKCPHRVLVWSDMLSPTMADKFTDHSMTPDEFRWLRDEATRRLQMLETMRTSMPDPASQRNIQALTLHLRTIVDENRPPFGYTVTTMPVITDAN